MARRLTSLSDNLCRTPASGPSMTAFHAMSHMYTSSRGKTINAGLPRTNICADLGRQDHHGVPVRIVQGDHPHFVSPDYLDLNYQRGSSSYQQNAFTSMQRHLPDRFSQILSCFATNNGQCYPTRKDLHQTALYHIISLKETKVRMNEAGRKSSTLVFDPEHDCRVRRGTEPRNFPRLQRAYPSRQTNRLWRASPPNACKRADLSREVASRDRPAHRTGGLPGVIDPSIS